MMNGPQINWIKYDPEQHILWPDGGEFLMAFEISSGGRTWWEVERLTISIDGDYFDIRYPCGCSFSSCEVTDLAYFALLPGASMPTTEEE